MIRLAKLRDWQARVSTAPALFTPEYKKELKADIRKAAKMVDMHARTGS
jgi:hypothetical protein